MADIARRAGIPYQRLWRATSGSPLTSDELDQLRLAGYRIRRDDGPQVTVLEAIPDGD